MFRIVKSAIRGVIKAVVNVLKGAMAIVKDIPAAIHAEIKKTSKDTCIRFVFTVGLLTAPIVVLPIGVVYELVRNYRQNKTVSQTPAYLGEIHDIHVSGSVYWDLDYIYPENYNEESTQDLIPVVLPEEVQQTRDEEDLTVMPNPITEETETNTTVENRVRSLQLSEAKEVAKTLGIKLRVGDKKKRLKVLQEEILQQDRKQIELALS